MSYTVEHYNVIIIPIIYNDVFPANFFCRNEVFIVCHQYGKTQSWEHAMSTDPILAPRTCFEQFIRTSYTILMYIQVTVYLSTNQNHPVILPKSSFAIC